nr:coiled-coil-helix-coiled-coil-helix domain-containing protein 7-like [Procambarus clarkii]XP_045622279.1 coiled-coil-helix-coiled-coil-helix domain-containing protein 7-like [Procambarus clarkii]
MFHGVLGDPSKTEDERNENIRKGTKVVHDDKNPCIKEHKLSFKCLDDNSYNRELCGSYFDNYNRCREFWNQVRVDRRKAGIVPHLPPAEERDHIKKEYMEKMRAKIQTH